MLLSAFGICLTSVVVLLPSIVFCIVGPDIVKGTVGSDALFLWNATEGIWIQSAIWGIREGNSANPHFTNVNGYTGKVNINSDLDQEYKGRVDFIGNLAVGHAWFILKNLTINDTNEYIASISDNVSGVLPYPVRLVVTDKITNVPPRFNAKPPLTRNIAEFQNLSLSCTAIGPPTPKITWVKIVGNKRVIKSTGTGSAILSIQNIRRDQNGTYECQAKNNPNEDQPVTTQTVVTVYYLPVIDDSGSSSKFPSWNGNSIHLKCVATGLPSPQISWYKPTNKQITTGVHIVPDGSEVTVTTKSDQEDYGQYKCRATNIVGSDVHIINVTQLFTPGPVDITTPEIEASSIAVRWTKPANDGGRPVIDYLLIITTKAPIATTKNYAVISGLEKNTLYTVKVYANNGIGYGLPLTTNITTKKKGKPAIPILSVTFALTTGSRLSVALKWAESDGNGGIITRYTIYMKDVTTKSDWTTIKDIFDLSNLKYTVTKNIQYGKTYKFIVTAWNKYGESVKDDWNAKTVNTTADKATYASGKAVSWSTGKEIKYIIGVITAILFIAIGLNLLQFVLLWRKVKVNGRNEKKNTQIRKSQQKATQEEIYDNDLEMEDTTLAVVTAPSEKKSRNPIPEYETIQEISGRTSQKETSGTSQGPIHYQGLNLASDNPHKRTKCQCTSL